MKEINFSTPEKDLKLSTNFAYCINPEDYISLTRELLKNKKLFIDIDRLDRLNNFRGYIFGEEEKKLIYYGRLLKKYKNTEPESELHNYLPEIIKDFKTYRYFYKEISASLKFNPLSSSDAGKHVLDKLLSFLEKYNNLISPKVLFRIVEVKPDETGLGVTGTDIHFDNMKLKIFDSHSSVKESIELSPGDLLTGNFIVYVVTIGPGIDDEVKSMMNRDEMFDAYLLNGIGAGAAEMVANDLNRYMNDTNTEINYKYRRLSPGYGDWNISDQSKIFKLLDPEKYIGVKLTDSHLMLPEKSTSGIMGLTLINKSNE